MCSCSQKELMPFSVYKLIVDILLDSPNSVCSGLWSFAMQDIRPNKCKLKLLIDKKLPTFLFSYLRIPFGRVQCSRDDVTDFSVPVGAHFVCDNTAPKLYCEASQPRINYLLAL